MLNKYYKYLILKQIGSCPRRPKPILYDRKGFIATIAISLLSSLTVVMSFTGLVLAVSFSDYINREEMRIQTNLNARSCLETVTLMLARDYFLFGQFDITRYGCSVSVNNDFQGGVLINIISRLDNVSIEMKREVVINDYDMNIFDE